MIRQLISAYLRDAQTPRRAITGLTHDELNATPVPNTWSIQQIIFHLLDSDLIAADRMKRIIAEDNPTLVYCDESAAARALPYDRLDAVPACELFEKNRLLTADMLQKLPEHCFSRIGTHTRRGALTLMQVLELYVQHVPHHMKFLFHKRALLGKPLEM